MDMLSLMPTMVLILSLAIQNTASIYLACRLSIYFIHLYLPIHRRQMKCHITR
uniref:Uncharacterized protein n=1 Tax=Arundo donax TaxID=35708 RepID=A0A0A9F5B1_ARUDO